MEKRREMGFKFVVCVNSEGQLRLMRWNGVAGSDRSSILGEIRAIVRSNSTFSHLHSNHVVKQVGKDLKVAVKRYNGLYFAVGMGSEEDVLFHLAMVPRFVQQLDLLFNNVCELDLVYNFPPIYNTLDGEYYSNQV